MKKVSMLLGYKGMTIKDWLLALQYKQKEYSENYLDLLEKMGIKLDRQERSLFANFLTGDLSEKISHDQVAQLAVKSGVRVE